MAVQTACPIAGTRQKDVDCKMWGYSYNLRPASWTTTGIGEATYHLQVLHGEYGGGRVLYRPLSHGHDSHLSI
jgi:hypothetical protein